MLYKVIHQVYRVEASSAEEAKKKAEAIIRSGQIRVVPAEPKQTLLGMMVWGAK